MDAESNLERTNPPSLSSPGSSGLSSLSNLGQQARVKQLKSAKWILIIIGVLMTVGHGIFFVMAESMVKAKFDKEVKNIQARGMEIDQVALAELSGSAVRSARVIMGGMMAIGIGLIVLGLFVYQYPLFCTVTGLVIYIGVQALNAFFDPTTIVQGIIIKILIIVGLVKAVQAALAYEREVGPDAEPEGHG